MATRSSRAQLEAWAAPESSGGVQVESGRLPSCWQGIYHAIVTVPKMRSLGGHEGTCLKLKVAKLDEDSSGDVSEKELQEQEADVASMLDSAKEFLLTVGVVAALVLSILYPVAFDDQNVHSETEDYFGKDFVDKLTHVHNACIIAGIAASVLLVYLTVRNYIQLIFWMPNQRDQVLFIQTASGQATVASLMGLTMVDMWICLATGATLARGPGAGLMALVMSLLAALYFARYEVKTAAWAEALLRLRVKEMSVKKVAPKSPEEEKKA
mmetsp:Transcript_63129/g.150498  ORF Transcript_63129/g.150498 Transcript_63129/m.150498 type:complete len:268 (-) Transcript_63129:91-894(-)